MRFAEINAEDEVQAVLDRMRFPPGWRVRLSPHQQTGFATILCEYQVPDSYHPDRMITAIGQTTLPLWDRFDIEQITRHVQYLCRERALHEVDEWLALDGKLLHDPHAVEMIQAPPTTYTPAAAVTMTKNFP